MESLPWVWKKVEWEPFERYWPHREIECSQSLVGIAALRSNRSVGIVEDIFSTDWIFSYAVIFICVVLLVDIIVCSLCSAPGCRRIGEEAVEWLPRNILQVAPPCSTFIFVPPNLLSQNRVRSRLRSWLPDLLLSPVLFLPYSVLFTLESAVVSLLCFVYHKSSSPLFIIPAPLEHHNVRRKEKRKDHLSTDRKTLKDSGKEYHCRIKAKRI